MKYTFRILNIPEPIFSIKFISLKTLINSLFLGAVTPLRNRFEIILEVNHQAEVISILSVIWIMCVDSMGTLFRPEYITDHFTLILEKNTNILKKIRFHDLRYSCVSLLLAKDISMKEIQEWLGHSRYSTTANIYSHLGKDAKIKFENVLPNTLTFAK